VTGAVVYWLLEARAEQRYSLGDASQTDKVVLRDILRFGVSYWFIVALCITFYSGIFPFQTFAVKFFMDAHGVSRWFVGVLGAGFDSVVNERANTWGWPKGRMRYNLAIARELPVFKPIPYVIEVDGVRHSTQAMLVAVGNGPSYGGGMMVCPDASLDDGLFDIMILNQISTLEFLRVFPKVFSGRHVGHPAVQILRGREVRLEASGIISYADGERFAPLPMSAQVVPGALNVLVPGPAVA